MAARYEAIRAFTESLCVTLQPEDYVVQSMPDASPVKWHLAHTSWFFETFVLEPAARARRAPFTSFHPRYGYLFNSYYVSVGARHERPQRGMLTRPSVEEVYEYRRHVDAAMRTLWGELADGAHADLIATIEVGLHHEQQHQELLLTDVKHLFAQNPLRPALRTGASPARGISGPELRPTDFSPFEEGLRSVGHGGGGFAFDNESPRHRTFVEAFALADRPMTNGEYLSFMAAGGYRRPELWLSEGWDAVQKQGWEAPLYWEREGDHWQVFTLHGLREIAPSEPVCHVSFYEADACARWAGARLPTEMEWEVAAESALVQGNFAESGWLNPRPTQVDEPARGPRAMFGDVWEWTASAYLPYPGYQAWAGSLGEYNGKFMSGQMVLRGGSCFTPASHMRTTYRNFFPPSARWQASGIRLAR
ncbi:ergothioneine biosynthesis protein EgtB [Chondromyces crocatus]|nr:ergothioneine biosynthesis protein EgtB [Chondromyces crocatus]